ncbi:MAG: acyl-[acyl-carrier-protein] thioesterase [Bacteroidaceae bacterium]|nr:acyl-[acyl-carrier-protein] thioesterase [Bacteroidaceae bacterium]
MTTKLPKIGSYDFLCEPFHCDFSKRLFIGYLGNHMLNSADYHSNDRDFGMNYLAPLHKTWVLSRLAIEVAEMPKAYDRFTVSTWVESAMRYFTNRNFLVKDSSSQQVLAYGKSIWAMIDTETRQPQDILSVRDGDIANYIEKETPCPIGKLSRVKMSKEAQKCHEAIATYTDTDYNGHVNSIKYIDHILDIYPLEYYKTHSLQRIDIAYVAESYCGDTLSFYKEEDTDGGTMISVRKKNDMLEEEVEVVRCKLSFSKSISK